MQGKELLQFKEDPQQGLFVRWVNKKPKEKGEKSKEERKESERQKELESYLKMEQKMKEQEMKFPSKEHPEKKEDQETNLDPSGPISFLKMTAEMFINGGENAEIDYSNGLRQTARGDRLVSRKEEGADEEENLGKRKVGSSLRRELMRCESC
jgi:hypothetical protein